jgi:hypothetical protein
MQIPVHEIMLGLREAVEIWLGLVAIIVIALFCLTVPGHRRERRSRPAPDRVDVNRLRRSRLAEQADELSRYAEEIGVAAARAGVTAQRRHDEWVAARRTQEAAWRAYEAAEAAACRVIQAAAFPPPRTPRTPAEYADRERFLHRAATEAFRRGELTIEEFADAIAHRNGWNPWLHPVDQETTLRRAARDRLLRAYRAASAMERSMWYATDMATLAKQSLEEELSVATWQAGVARTRLIAATAPRRRHAIARQPVLATR